jgi:hypothetical protein
MAVSVPGRMGIHCVARRRTVFELLGSITIIGTPDLLHLLRIDSMRELNLVSERLAPQRMINLE